MSTTPFDIVPGDFVARDFADRAANPRAAMGSRYALRPWTPGVHPDVDSGRVRSKQQGEIPSAEQINVRDTDPADQGAAQARFDGRHSRWRTHRADQ